MDIVYATTLDNRYEVKVIRTGNYCANLILTDNTTGEVLLTEPTSLSYSAIVGPDVDDVADWQQRAITFVDNRDLGSNQNKEPELS